MNKTSRSHGSLRRVSRSKSTSPHRRRRASMSSSSSDSSRSRLPGLDSLKKITINIKGIANNEQSSTGNRREIVNPQNVTILRRPGEGSRPIFDRDELKTASSTSERRIIRRSPSRSPSRSRSHSESRSSVVSRSRSRSRSSSRARRRSTSRPRPRRQLIDTRYVNRAERAHRSRSRSRRRRRSHSHERSRHRYAREHADVYRQGVIGPMPMMRPVRPVPFFGAPGLPYVNPHGYLPPSVAAAYANPRVRMARFRPPPPRPI